MTGKELNLQLIERCQKFDLKQKTFECLENLLISNKKDFFKGFAKDEVSFVFDGFSYHVDRRYSEPVIRARIGFYVHNEAWFQNLERIGYYELETNFDGEIVDDWFVLE